MLETWPLSINEYANLMGMTKQAVSLQIKENRLPESVQIKKYNGKYLLLTRLDEGTCRYIRFIGGSKYFINGCKIHK